MISETTLQKIESLANQVAAQQGVQIYDIEFGGGSQGASLRVFIDKEGGVGIEDCANVSRGLSELLDAEDPIPGGNYNLEVSSPGLERPLKKTWHFQGATGKKVWLKLNQPLQTFGVQEKTLQSAKQIKDTLVAVEGDQVKLQIGEESVLIPFNAIEKAKLVFDFNEGKQGKKGHPPKGSRK